MPSSYPLLVTVATQLARRRVMEEESFEDAGDAKAERHPTGANMAVRHPAGQSVRTCEWIQTEIRSAPGPLTRLAEQELAAGCATAVR